MFLQILDLCQALGVTPTDLVGGATWRLPCDDGKAVVAQICHDAEDNSFTASAFEAIPGQDSQVAAIVSGRPNADGFEVAGIDLTGEGSDPADALTAAAAFRRQLAGILASAGGIRVA